MNYEEKRQINEMFHCAGCGKKLSEHEFEHYENHLDQQRLCKNCVMEGRAR